MINQRDRYQVIVIGGGHAGVEAAWAAANIFRGAGTNGEPPAVALVTLDHAKTGVMSCNPCIGGIAKGQMVREIDALGGLMAHAADATGIMFKVLNTSKGPAVRSPRCQSDKHAYARAIKAAIDARPEIDVIEGAAESFIIHTNADGTQTATGITVSSRNDPHEPHRTLRAHAVVLTTGTFMRGLMHTGDQRTEGGRAGEAPAVGISATLNALGFELGRLKTGTPPRLKRSTIDWDNLDPQYGDTPPAPFSFLTRWDAGTPPLPQVDCRVTSTNPRIHEQIRANLHRAPLFSGAIQGEGPRYCPSIEDKVVRFQDRDAHHVFLEPESHESDWVYCNGISSSLPADVQDHIVAHMPGCEHATILQHGYAVEYDMVRPHQIHATCETKAIQGLFLAGQINGTSGYEEAAGQGLLAGLNAARRAQQRDPVTLGRDQAYIGVMMDDLVTKTPREPYRMFTSRAEHRLILRADNAADRLTPLAQSWSLTDASRDTSHASRTRDLAELRNTIDASHVNSKPLAKHAKQPGYTTDDLAQDLAAHNIDAHALAPGALDTALAELQYEGYIARQHAEIKRHAEMERRRIPKSIDPSTITGLRAEAAQALARFRPDTVGQAARLEGINPADISVLLIAMRNRTPRDTASQTAPA